jgi:glycerol-3-phosphate dehydrogenase
LPDPADALAIARREYDALVPAETLPHLLAAYGSRYREVLSIAADRPEWRTNICEASPVIGAELVWAGRHEMALTLGDAVIRRTPLGALGDPGPQATARAAELVGSELGWSDERRLAEIDAVRLFYSMRLATR